MNNRLKRNAGPRRGKNTFVTKSGQTIKIHRNLGERFQASREARARRKAARLAGMPKSPIKRFFYRLHPKRLYKYWFSREGAIMALKVAGIGIIAMFLLIVGVFAYFRKDLPDIKSIAGDNLGGSIRYYDRTGQTLLWEDYDAVKRIPVEDKQISQFIKDATIAIEDKDFFKHGGFDMRGIMRAAINDVVGSGGRQGGSTITQQLVKLNNDWTKDRTYTRKVKELILAVELERSYSKQEILTGYLNAAPYGNVQVGVEAAARDYFEKSAKDLSLDEAAFLAAIPKAPSEYSPYGSIYKADPEVGREDLIGRQHYILDQMVEERMITDKQRDDAKKVDTLAKVKEPKPKFTGITAPYFVLTAKEELEQKLGSETIKRTGWKVITTLDLTLQKHAEEQVQKGLTQVKRQGGDSIAFAAEDVKTGQMVALVGGVDFNNDEYGQNNYARLKLPPGSSYKPYDYLALMEHTTNFGAGSVLYDTKGAIPGYPCTTGPTRTGNCAIDYDLRYPGPLTLRYALGGSRNVPAMKAMLIAGVDKTIATSKKLMQSPGSKAGEARGDYKCYQDDELTREAPCYTAAAIGDGAYLKLDENVHGYASISRNGLNIPQTYILKIENANGKVIDEWKPSKGVQAVRQDAAYIVADMLSDPRASYLASKPHNYKGHKMSYKTGTTNDSKDGWMMGFSTQYAAGVWVGYHNRQREMTGFMENMTQPILTGWMRQAHDPLKPEDRPKPSGVKTLPAFVVRTHVGVGSVEPSPSTDLYPSWYKQPSRSGAKRTIDIVSNKLATDCTPNRAKKEVSDADANSFSGDRFVGGGGTNTSEQDDVHKCDDARPSVQITGAPSSCNGGCSITIVASGGTHPLSSGQFPGAVNLIIDGQTVQSFALDNSDSGSPKTLTFNYGGSGAKTVTVQVVDSVLYDASDETNIAFSDGGGFSITDVDRQTASRVRFEWQGGDGPYDLYIDGLPWSTCQNQNDHSCSVNNLSGAHTATIRDSDGNVTAARAVPAN